jgi:hypothetical protein
MNFPLNFKKFYRYCTFLRKFQKRRKKFPFDKILRKKDIELVKPILIKCAKF